MMWHEIVFDTDQQSAELWSEGFFEAGALSVSVEDADRDSDAEQPLFGEPGMVIDVEAWQHSRLVVLVEQETDAQALVELVANNLSLAVPKFLVRDVAAQDWVRLTQSQFEPIEITPRLWIVPSWHEIDVPNAITLALDPGLAFGTGSHPTTQLCLRWLEANLKVGQSVMDYGCGSGILAIAAKKLGAGIVAGIDIDPQAMIAAHDNANQNQVDVIFGLPDELDVVQYDVVVANILANPLKALAPLLANLCKPGGRLILSGILTRQVEELQEIYAPYVKLSLWQTQEEWVCLVGERAI